MKMIELNYAGSSGSFLCNVEYIANVEPMSIGYERRTLVTMADKRRYEVKESVEQVRKLIEECN